MYIAGSTEHALLFHPPATCSSAACVVGPFTGCRCPTYLRLSDGSSTLIQAVPVLTRRSKRASPRYLGRYPQDQQPDNVLGTLTCDTRVTFLESSYGKKRSRSNTSLWTNLLHLLSRATQKCYLPVESWTYPSLACPNCSILALLGVVPSFLILLVGVWSPTRTTYTADLQL